MKTLTIYYIATSNYKTGFKHFKQNLHYFFPQFKKSVIIISDGLKEWDGVEENGITYKVQNIQHFCWPIITLFKMKYIFDFKVESDYACYFNGNLQCNVNYDFTNSNIDFNKLNVSVHASSNDDIIYDNNNFENVSINSLAHITEPYKYIQGGFFFGPSSIVYKMCQDVSKMCEMDLKNNIIPQWHDESYLNKWCVDNKHLVNKQRFMSLNTFQKDCMVGIIDTIQKDRFTPYNNNSHNNKNEYSIHQHKTKHTIW